MRYTTGLVPGKQYTLEFGRDFRRVRYCEKIVNGMPCQCAACGRPAKDYLVFLDLDEGRTFALSISCWRKDTTRLRAGA